MKIILKRTTAIAALAALPLAPMAAQAENQGQQSQSEQTQNQQNDSQQTQNQSSQQGNQQASGQPDQQGNQQASDQSGQQSNQQDPGQSGQQANQQDSGAMTGENTQAGVIPGTGPVQNLTPEQQAMAADALIATVGDTQIRRSDVLDVIALLPPQLQQQPAEMLIPMALDQLVTRELILQEAREAGLENDQEVTAMTTDSANEQTRENAMVQVWLSRELEGAVTDEEVQSTYDTIKSQMGEGAPPLSQIRPQIEQDLRRQAFAEISSNLHSDADITVYGPDGQPLTQ